MDSLQSLGIHVNFHNFMLISIKVTATLNKCINITLCLNEGKYQL